MNIKKTSIVNILSILFLIFTMQKNLQATNIINNKDISIDIDGKIKTQSLFNINDKKSNDNLLFLKIEGKTKEKNNISTYGKLEELIDINTINKKNKNNTTQLVYIGVKHNKLGEIKLGKNYSVINKTLSYTDISPYFKSKILVENNLTGINSNTVTYKKTFKSNNKKKIFKKITLTTQYQNRSIVLNQNNLLLIKNGWGIGYNIATNNGIEISSSYANQDFNINKNNKYFNTNNIKNNFYSSAWSTSIKYNINKFYIAYSYILGKNLNLIKYNKYINNHSYIDYKFANKSENINITAKYNFKSGITPIIGYTQSTIKNFNKTKYNNKNIIKNTDIEKYFNIGVTYNFNKSFLGYIDYKINQLPNNLRKFCNNNNLSLGFVYKF